MNTKTHAQRDRHLRPVRQWFALALLLAAMPGTGAEAVDGARLPHTPTVGSPIGRIFFAPAERRHRGGEGAPTVPHAAEASSGGARALGERRVVNGVLSSSRRQRAVWVDGNVNVRLLNADREIRLLRPGQSIDRFGVIKDLVPAGAVTRR